MQSGERFHARYGPWALVAGAAQGIGAAFAERLAGRGLWLVLVDRDERGLDRLAERLAREHGGRCLAVCQDLGEADLLERLEPVLVDREIGLLVYNAAHSHVGSFLDQPLAEKLSCLRVNCQGPLLLAHALAPAMARRGRGGLIFMSSLAGTHGHRLVASYAASKAFDWILAEALWDELGERGLDVLAVCAGMTRTPGFLASAPALGALRARLVQEPGQVVDEALAALGSGPRVVTGLPNRLAALASDRLLPRGLASRWLGRAMAGLYPGRLTSADRPRSGAR